MYFCDDVDLLVWEPAVFLEAAFAHQAVISAAAGTLTGTGLLTGAVLGGVAPGMVATVVLADGSLTQLMEVTAVTDASHATVSALRGRDSETAIGPLIGGAVKVTVVTFRPQIAAVGDDLLAAIGVASDRADDAAPASANLAGFRAAAAFGTLAAIYRTLTDAAGATAATAAKKTFYDNLAASARRGVAGLVDEDGDGTPETPVRADVPVLERV